MGVVGEVGEVGNMEGGVDLPVQRITDILSQQMGLDLGSAHLELDGYCGIVLWSEGASQRQLQREEVRVDSGACCEAQKDQRACRLK